MTDEQHNKLSCPCCRGTQYVTIARYPRSVTSDSVIVDRSVSNEYCHTCGLFWNSQGARGCEDAFYSEDYNLLSHAADAEFVYETDTGLQGINAATAEYFAQSLRLPQNGSMIDVGCGKGLLLRAFGNHFPLWKLHGVEPSRSARAFFEHAPVNSEIHNGTLESSPFITKKFDLVTCTGVLEHVPDPVAFASQLKALLGVQGTLFISVPNFAKNPTDLITFDHLSRFTPEGIIQLLARAGLEVVELLTSDRVPMWIIARVGTVEEPPIDDGATGRASVAWLDSIMTRFSELGRLGSDHRIGIYGTGLLAMAAVALGHFPADRIFAFFDDNRHLHGTTRLDRGVYSLAQARELGITDMTFSANPVYFEQMSARVSANCPGVKLWTLPALAFSRQIET
jgi:SAM-dependent methyltransferase